MASVKMSVDVLEQQKKEYERAVKNLENALEQIKKVNHALGKDAMLEGVRTALTKLSASLETRAGLLLLMTKALEQSGEQYAAAQKNAVAKSNQFRAHHKDFYGNPVVVTVAAGAAGSSVAGTASSDAAGAVSSSVAGTGSGTAAEPVSRYAAGGTGSTADTAKASQADMAPSPAVYRESGHAAAISRVSEHARNTASPGADGAFGPVEESDPSGSFVSGIRDEPAAGSAGTAFPDPAVAAAGAAAAGAAIGGAAGGVIGAFVKSGQKPGKTKPEQKPTGTEKKQNPSADIEAQLEAARERLRRFQEMEERV